MSGQSLLVGEASPYMGPELYVCFSRAAYGDGVSLAGQADTCLALGAFHPAVTHSNSVVIPYCGRRDRRVGGGAVQCL